MINSDQLNNQGYCIVKKLISDEWLMKFFDILPDVFKEHQKIQVYNGSDIKEKGLAFHVILSDGIFIDFLDDLLKIGFISALRETYFKTDLILNSFSALDNIPNQITFASKPHRDVRFYTSDIPMMLNMLIMLDDFTEDNGSTLLLPGSHKVKEKPTDDYFFSNAIKILGKGGDVLLFNSNIWHAAGLNTTAENRKALPLTFSMPLIKQLLDYPRALGPEVPFDENLKQLLGYFAQAPCDLDEWYQPFEKRTYKKNQNGY